MDNRQQKKKAEKYIDESLASTNEEAIRVK